MATRYGTSYFITHAAAERYYGDRETASQKLAAGEIHVGKPDVKPNARLRLDETEGRYFIEEGAP